VGFCWLFNLCTSEAATTNQPSTTNFWVVNVNYALKAYIQSGDQVLVGTVPSKQIINLISGATNRANQIATATNTGVASVTVTNSPFFITNGAGDYTFTNDYILTNSTFFGPVPLTNNIDFTNDLSFTEVTNEPLTYTFNNQVQINSNLTLLLFPELQTSAVTAVQSTNDPAVFTLSGVTTNTTPIFQVMPDFSQGKGAKLVCVFPVVNVTNNTLSPKFQVRYSVGGTSTNVDVSDFFLEPTGFPTPPFSTVRIGHLGFAIPQYGMREIVFDTTFAAQLHIQDQPGTSLTMIGLDQQTRSAVLSKGKFAALDVAKQRRLAGGGLGTLLGQFGRQNFTNNTCVLKGAITFGAGHLETSD
jgi:hypothetical protein